MAESNSVDPRRQAVARGGEALVALLREQLTACEALDALLRQTRAAVTAANGAAVRELCDAERRLVQQVQSRDRDRRRLSDQLARVLGIEAAERGDDEPGRRAAPISPHDAADRAVPARPRSALPEIPLTALAPHLPDATARELLDLRGRIQRALAEIRRQSAIVSSAATSVARHLGGIAASFRARLTDGGVYGRRGRVEADAGSLRVDLRS